MAATNYTPIQLYFSTTASAVPLAANLAQGELAINITDGKLYYEDNGGVVQVIATKGAGTIGGSTTQIQYNNAGALAGNAAMVFNNSTNVTTLTTLNLTNALGAIYGGTAQSTYAQGDVLYASAANTLSKLGIGTVNYILTSSGSVPQWSAPSSISVLTATNLAGGLAGSVPYQSALDTTTFLAIGAANRVMTSTGSAPQWVTSLTSLTGVSSSSITNTSLTSGYVVYSGTGGLQSNSASLTFNGTTLSAGGFSTTGLSTLVQTVKIGDSNFNGVAVFAPATPAKLYMGTGTVTDVTSAVSATNTTGAIASLAITPIAATNTGVTYTNASTLYIAGAPSAGTNISITNPYALYIAAGASYLGGAVTIGGNTAVTGTVTTTGTAATNTTAYTAGGTTTGFNRGRITNTGGDIRFGIDSSVGSEAVAGSAAYSSFIGSFTNTPLYLVSNSAIVGTVSSTGLAVTGALSATGTVSASSGGIQINTVGAARNIFTNTVDGTDDGYVIITPGSSATTARGGYFAVAGNENSTFGNGGNAVITTGNVSGAKVKLQFNETDVAVVSSTGLAVTGTGSFTNIVNITRTGTTNLQLESPTGGSGISFRLAGVDKWGFGRGIVDNSNTLQWYDNDAASTRMTLNASGNLSVGDTNSSGRITAIKAGTATIAGLDTTAYAAGVGATLDLGGNYRSTGDFQTFVRIAAEKANATDADYGYGMGFYVTTNSGSTFGTKAMTIDSSGNLIIGSTNAQLQLNATTNNGNISVISSAANANLNLASKGAGSINFNATGGFYCTQIYSTAVGGTNRAVYSDNGGTIGYLSSVRASKINIENITNASWLMQLNPVKFNYRKKDEDGNYTEEFDNTIEYGLIAEEAEIIKQELCFYDEVDGTQVLRGVNYQKLVVPMLKAIQEQQALITQLTARITALEGA